MDRGRSTVAPCAVARVGWPGARSRPLRLAPGLVAHPLATSVEHSAALGAHGDSPGLGHYGTLLIASGLARDNTTGPDCELQSHDVAWRSCHRLCHIPTML